MYLLLILLCGIILISIAGYSESIMDTIMFHYKRSKFVKKTKQIFWNPKKSWKNKYKEDLKTPKFFLSTTLLVFLTDAWHRFKFYRTSLLFITLPLVGYLSPNFIVLVIFVIILRIFFGLSFTVFYYYFSNKMDELKKNIMHAFKQIKNKFIKR